MSTLSNITSKLNEKPNSRERIIFFLALIAFVGVFFKACVMESQKAVGEVQAELDKLTSEQTELRNQTALIGDTTKKNENKTEIEKIVWIGSRQTASLSSDALVKSAAEYNVSLVKFAFPDYKEKQNLMYKPISMTLTGSLGDLGRYLEHSEHLEVPLVIENLALEQTGEFADFITLRIEGGFYAEK